MPSPSHPVERFSFSTALFGMLVLTLGMGLGRFLYTPMLPVMMAEGSFSFSQLSWIASGNYAGYLAGSLLFSFGAFHQPSRLRPFLLASALASGLLILAMAWLLPFILVLLIRVLAGFGYIIVATYLPLMAKDAGSPLLTAHLWTLVGLSIVPGCFGWLWAAKRWGALPCLTANLLVQAICVLLTLASDSPLLLIISSLGFGGTFMGTTSLVMTIARQLSVPGNLNLLGFVTLIYGIGQILGPALTSMLGNGTSALAGATLCGAAALFIAALISTVQLFKLQVVTS